MPKRVPKEFLLEICSRVGDIGIRHGGGDAEGNWIYIYIYIYILSILEM